MAKLVVCKTCGRSIARTTDRCPWCGMSRGINPVRLLAWLIIFAAVFWVLYNMMAVISAQHIM